MLKDDGGEGALPRRDDEIGRDAAAAGGRIRDVVDLGAAGVAHAGLPDLQRPPALVVELAGERGEVIRGGLRDLLGRQPAGRSDEEQRDGEGKDPINHGAHPIPAD